MPEFSDFHKRYWCITEILLIVVISPYFKQAKWFNYLYSLSLLLLSHFLSTSSLCSRSISFCSDCVIFLSNKLKNWHWIWAMRKPRTWWHSKVIMTNWQIKLSWCILIWLIIKRFRGWDDVILKLEKLQSNYSIVL